ncbi:sulfotransferase [Nocardia sp. NPDC046763]|uniref:sulfotransferase n=1 Tax=Nocardia sp. NPDC046763 TaxID=3155256 RepID=UPI003410E97F
MIVEASANRLLLREGERRHPQITEIPIAQPVFVLGLLRCGTTFLHNLLALHPQSIELGIVRRHHETAYDGEVLTDTVGLHPVRRRAFSVRSSHCRSMSASAGT